MEKIYVLARNYEPQYATKTKLSADKWLLHERKFDHDNNWSIFEIDLEN